MIAASKHVHAGLTYDSIEQFLAAAVPFTREGIRANELVLSISNAGNNRALANALSEDAASVRYMDVAEIYGDRSSPATRLLEAVERAGAGRPFRVIMEPVHDALTPRQIERSIVNDAASNVFMRDVAGTIVCAYDTRISGVNGHSVQCVHPYLLTHTALQDNAQFVEPPAFYALRLDRHFTAAPPAAETLPFAAESLPALRRSVARIARAHGLDAMRVDDLVVAACEAAANAIEHGAGEGILRTWSENGELICEAQSAGLLRAGPFLGYRMPPVDSERGRGFWLMRQLCDWVDVRSEAEETFVRMHVSL